MARSQVIDNDLNPKWNEGFKLLVHEPEHQASHSLAPLCELPCHAVSCNSELLEEVFLHSSAPVLGHLKR